MSEYRQATVFFLLALVCPIFLHAGQYNITKVDYKVTPSSDGTSTLVWVRAEARYAGTIDAHDNSWTLETELIALGSVTERARPGSGVPPSREIDNEPVGQYGAFRNIPDCKVFSNEGQLYRGQAAVAIHHHGGNPEVDHGVGEWGRTECDSSTGSGGGEEGGDEEGTNQPAPTDGTGSPILIDLDRRGFDVSSLDEGVLFDIDGNGATDLVAWTKAEAGDGWLALDRNQNGYVDDGRELFGNFTEQPDSEAPNGYRALQVFDHPDGGGDGNGILDSRDAIYPHLWVWIDSNRDGQSQIDELSSLADSGVRWLEVEPIRSSRRDRHGNLIPYKALVRLEHGMTQSVDAFLRMASP